MSIAIYPGTFDPVTNGHLDIIQRATVIFDIVIVAVAKDTAKDTLFDLDERLDLLNNVTSAYENVYTESFSGLLTGYAAAKGAKAIVRSLRSVSDFEYEMQIAMMNKKLASDIETIFLTTSTEYSFLSSSIVKQVASLGGKVDDLVPGYVEKKLMEKYSYC